MKKERTKYVVGYYGDGEAIWGKEHGRRFHYRNMKVFTYREAQRELKTFARGAVIYKLVPVEAT